LFEGNNAAFEKEVEGVRKGSKKKTLLRKEGNYLLRHSKAGRLNYAEAKQKK